MRYVFATLCLLLLPMNFAHAEGGRTDMLTEEQAINAASYRPTLPEIQLGYTTNLSVDESGTVTMDTEKIQGILNAEGLLAIEAVKGKDDVYYVLEKGGYILSILAKGNQLVSQDGKVVQLELVDWLYGRNGLADHEGFKSNLVPQGFLPKTGLGEDNQAQVAEGLVDGWYRISLFWLNVLIMLYGTAVMWLMRINTLNYRYLAADAFRERGTTT